MTEYKQLSGAAERNALWEQITQLTAALRDTLVEADALQEYYGDCIDCGAVSRGYKVLAAIDEAGPGMPPWPDYDELETLPGIGPMRRSEIVKALKEEDTSPSPAGMQTQRRQVDRVRARMRR